jgi:hypothetical protein
VAAALHACEGQVFIDLQLLIYKHKYICLFFCVVGWMLGSKPAAYNLEVFGRWLITVIVIRYHLKNQVDYNYVSLHFILTANCPHFVVDC